MTLLHKEAPITEDDYAQLSETYKISINIVEEVVTALRKGNKPPLYEGTVRQRIRELCADITTQGDSSPGTLPVEHSATETLRAAPEPQEEAKNPPSEELSEDLEPALTAERESVAEYAATKLLSAMTSEDQSFLISDDGICTVNPHNPPTIQKSYEVVHNVLLLQELPDRMRSKSSWMLGSMVSSLEDLHGEAFSISQMCENDESSYNTIATATGVYKAFQNKRYNVPFTTHKEVHYAKLDKEPKANKELQKMVLKKCETYDLTSKHARDLCSIIKNHDGTEAVRSIRSHDQAKSLIDAYKSSKAKYFIYNEGQWTWVNGLDGQLPEGAVVLDAKNNKAYAEGKLMGEIAKAKKD